MELANGRQQPGVVDDDGRLIGHDRKEREIVPREERWPVALDADRADHPFTEHQRSGHQRARAMADGVRAGGRELARAHFGRDGLPFGHRLRGERL